MSQDSVNINLWCLMTALDHLPSPNSLDRLVEECRPVVEAAAKAGGFGNEISLEITPYGNWVVKIHSTDSDDHVTLTVCRGGSIAVERKRALSSSVSETTRHTIS